VLDVTKHFFNLFNETNDSRNNYTIEHKENETVYTP